MIPAITRTSLARAAALASLLAAAPVAAQTHVYNLTDGSLLDANGGPSLALFGTNSPAIVGSANGYHFDVGGGFTLSNALVNPGIYSIELRFLFDQTSGYRKIIDFKNRTADQGFYDLGGAANFYNFVGGSGTPFTNGTMVTAVLTRSSAGIVTGYVNGTQQFSFNDAGSQAGVFSATNNIINFLHDDVAQGTEQSSGFVDYIRVYNETLTGSQVHALTPPAVAPEPATVALLATGLAAVGGLARRRRQG